MAQNVKFYFGAQAKYDALLEKDSMALYFIEDTQRLYKGDVLLAVGAKATSLAAGLMSAEDKAKLDDLVAASGASNLTAVDGTIKLTETEDGKSIGVAVSTQDGNSLVVAEDGLFVPVAKEISIPEYAIEKQEVAEDGFAVSYKLKKTVGGESSYVGDVINIAKDMVLKSATLEIVTEEDVPYDGAEVGDPYIDMAFNDTSASHVYIPVSGLVDTYTAGYGIEIIDGKVSVKIAEESNGLVAVDGALKIELATSTSAGALSAVDKAFIDSIPEVFASKEMVAATYERMKYEIAYKPVGTIVDYRDHEIRVMCPADTQWVKQSVGATGSANMYYMGFKAYAPDGAVSFKEDDKEFIEDQTMYYFENNEFAGIDKFGRKYSIVWLALATYDEASDTWTYFGKNSTAEKYIGWYYTVEWFDENGVKIGADQIRINLSNEDCHYANKPYYMANYATVDQITSIEEAYSWGEL